MKSSNKIKLANLTTWIMVVTISIIAFFFIGFVVSNTFDLNVFTSRTSDFIYSFIGFTSVLVLCAAILNISLNIGLIADSKIKELKEPATSGFVTSKFLLYAFGLIAIIIMFMFLGDFMTRQNEKKRIISEATDVIARYQTSIDKIFTAFADSSKLGDIPDVLKFLSSQKQEFTSVTLITSDKFDEQLTFLYINGFDSNFSLKKPFYNNSFYKCSIQDCDYLNKFFTGQTKETHFWTEKNDYKLYFPFDRNGRKFILLFSKYERYGKVGSYN